MSWRAPGTPIRRQTSLLPPDHAGEDLIQPLAALYQGDLNLSLILPDAVGDSVLGFAEVEVVRAQALKGMGLDSRGERWLSPVGGVGPTRAWARDVTTRTGR